MDSHSILDHDGELPDSNAPDSQASVRFPGEDDGRSLAEMAERDLSATLQLLAERAQYITGATGAAIALRDHEGNGVCRASAGPSAPEVGAQLQINSGLSGESVRTRQNLRCDDASTDTRVNRESCEALGISSVVVMPLLRGHEVIGVFELFSNQANVFEARDLAALERLGAMVHAALEHSAASLGLDPLPADQTTHPSLPLSGNGHHGEASEPSFAPPVYESTQAFSQDDDLIMERAVAQPEEPSTAASLASSGIAFHVRMPAKTFRPPEKEETPPASPSIALSPQAAAEETEILEVQPEMVAQPAAAEQADNVLGEEPAPTSMSSTANDAPFSPEPANAESTTAARRADGSARSTRWPWTRCQSAEVLSLRVPGFRRPPALPGLREESSRAASEACANGCSRACSARARFRRGRRRTRPHVEFLCQRRSSGIVDFDAQARRPSHPHRRDRHRRGCDVALVLRGLQLLNLPPPVLFLRVPVFHNRRHFVTPLYLDKSVTPA